MLNDMNKWIRMTTDIGIALLGLAIIVQVLFGNAVPFFGGNVINSIANVIANLGAQGMVGLLVVWLLFVIFNRPISQR